MIVTNRPLDLYNKPIEMIKILDKLKSEIYNDITVSEDELLSIADSISNSIEERFNRKILPDADREALIIIDRLMGIKRGDRMSCIANLRLSTGDTLSITWTSTLEYD